MVRRTFDVAQRVGPSQTGSCLRRGRERFISLSCSTIKILHTVWGCHFQKIFTEWQKFKGPQASKRRAWEENFHIPPNFLSFFPSCSQELARLKRKERDGLCNLQNVCRVCSKGGHNGHHHINDPCRGSRLSCSCCLISNGVDERPEKVREAIIWLPFAPEQRKIEKSPDHGRAKKLPDFFPHQLHEDVFSLLKYIRWSMCGVDGLSLCFGNPDCDKQLLGEG